MSQHSGAGRGTTVLQRVMTTGKLCVNISADGQTNDKALRAGINGQTLRTHFYCRINLLVYLLSSDNRAPTITFHRTTRNVATDLDAYAGDSDTPTD